jgi:hypothetical protein
VTKTRGFFHPDQNVLNATQDSLPTKKHVFEGEILSGGQH